MVPVPENSSRLGSVKAGVMEGVDTNARHLALQVARLKLVSQQIDFIVGVKEMGTRVENTDRIKTAEDIQVLPWQQLNIKLFDQLAGIVPSTIASIEDSINGKDLMFDFGVELTIGENGVLMSKVGRPKELPILVSTEPTPFHEAGHYENRFLVDSPSLSKGIKRCIGGLACLNEGLFSQARDNGLVIVRQVGDKEEISDLLVPVAKLEQIKFSFGAEQGLLIPINNMLGGGCKVKKQVREMLSDVNLGEMVGLVFTGS